MPRPKTLANVYGVDPDYTRQMTTREERLAKEARDAELLARDAAKIKEPKAEPAKAEPAEAEPQKPAPSKARKAPKPAPRRADAGEAKPRRRAGRRAAAPEPAAPAETRRVEVRIPIRDEFADRLHDHDFGKATIDQVIRLASKTTLKSIGVVVPEPPVETRRVRSELATRMSVLVDADALAVLREDHDPFEVLPVSNFVRRTIDDAFHAELDAVIRKHGKKR